MADGGCFVAKHQLIWLVSCCIALRELKRDRDRIVLTADKGVAMVVMDKQDYINKANQLLTKILIKLSLKTLPQPLKINSLTYSGL